jgi:hypothetical protein
MLQNNPELKSKIDKPGTTKHTKSTKIKTRLSCYFVPFVVKKEV